MRDDLKPEKNTDGGKMPKQMIGVIIGAAALSAVVGGGFGYAFAKQQRSQFGGQLGTGQMMNRGRAGAGFGANGSGPGADQNGNRQFGRGVMGEVTSIDDKSLTVKLPDGSSKIVLLADSTQVEKTTQAQKTDLAKGTQIRVIGTPNSDGSVAASMIMLNPPTPPAATPSTNK